MSQFYDLASLVVIPSGYKASTIYAQKPLTTDGQLSFSRASTATRVNASGLIEAVASNVPRLDYTNSSCPRLLLEPQRTNVATYSEQFNNAAWTLDGDGVGQSVTANYAISPDGYQNADRLQLNKTGGTFSRIRQTASGANTYTFSVYMKSNTGVSQNVGLRLDTTGVNRVVTTSWQRFTLTATVGTPQAQIILFDSISGNDEIADILIWGAQLEAGSYATSYIPTTAASVTRVADVASKTGISSLIGQTEGTLFADIDSLTNTDGSRAIAIQGGGSRLGITLNNTDVGYFVVTSAGLIISTSFALTTPVKKVALSYKSGITTLFCNGVLINTDTATYTLSGSLAELYLGQFEFAVGTGQNAQRNGQALLFKTALTNAQLAELTTL
jgi:hypothetical protein